MAGREEGGLGRGEASAAETRAKLLQREAGEELRWPLPIGDVTRCSSALRVVLGLHGSPLWGPGVQQMLWGCSDLFTLGMAILGWKP